MTFEDIIGAPHSEQEIVDRGVAAGPMPDLLADILNGYEPGQQIELLVRSALFVTRVGGLHQLSEYQIDELGIGIAAILRGAGFHREQ